MPPSVPTPDDKLYASGTSHETPLPSAPIQGKEASIAVAVAYTLQPDGAVRCDWDMDASAALPGKIANYLFPCAPAPLRARVGSLLRVVGRAVAEGPSGAAHLAGTWLCAVRCLHPRRLLLPVRRPCLAPVWVWITVAGMGEADCVPVHGGKTGAPGRWSHHICRPRAAFE